MSRSCKAILKFCVFCPLTALLPPPPHPLPPPPCPCPPPYTTCIRSRMKNVSTCISLPCPSSAVVNIVRVLFLFVCTCTVICALSFSCSSFRRAQLSRRQGQVIPPCQGTVGHSRLHSTSVRLSSCSVHYIHCHSNTAATCCFVHIHVYTS